MMLSDVRGCPAKMAIVDRHPLQSCAHFFACAGVSAKISQTLIVSTESYPRVLHDHP